MTAKKNKKKNKNKNKKPAANAKQAEAKTAPQKAEMASAERPALMDPWQWIPDWFEQWPPVIGRRVPEFMTQIGLAEPMKVEERVEGDVLVIRAEIPGVDPESDIDISVTDGKLTISAHREQREETKTDDSFRSEFRYGSFHRSLLVPWGTEPEDVEASYIDGILEVRLPATNEEAPEKTRVPISRS